MRGTSYSTVFKLYGFRKHTANKIFRNTQSLWQNYSTWQHCMVCSPSINSDQTRRHTSLAIHLYLHRKSAQKPTHSLEVFSKTLCIKNLAFVLCLGKDIFIRIFYNTLKFYCVNPGQCLGNLCEISCIFQRSTCKFLVQTPSPLLSFILCLESPSAHLELPCCHSKGPDSLGDKDIFRQLT